MQLMIALLFSLAKDTLVKSILNFLWLNKNYFKNLCLGAHVQLSSSTKAL